MNILIADDESMVRAGLRSMLEELDIGLNIIGETKNGQETVAFVQEHHPDLVFVDIKMPVLNGLEAIAQCKQHSPYTKWIILSGYSEFHYAQEALRLGACNYLLKPVSLNDIKNCISHIYEQYQKQLLERNKQLEYECIGLLTKNDINSYAREEAPSLKAGALLFLIDHHFSGREADLWTKQFLLQLQQMLYSEFLHGELQIAAFMYPNGSPLLCWTSSASTTQKIEERLAQLYHAISQFISQNADQQIRLSAVTICGQKDIQTTDSFALPLVAASIKQIYAQPELRYLLKDREIASVQMLVDNEADWKSICQQAQQIADCYRLKDYVGYSQHVAAINKSLAETYHPATKEWWMRIYHNLCFAMQIDGQINEQIDGHPTGHFDGQLKRQHDGRLDDQHGSGDPTKWTKQLNAYGEQLLARSARNDQTYKDVVQLATDYIDENYMHDIGIKQIAEALQVTPNYLSSLFHKKHGITFIKYLTKLRMLKAKELVLNSHQLKITEAAEAVGYYSPRHFTKLFKEYYGCSPTELREQLQNTSDVTVD